MQHNNFERNRWEILQIILKQFPLKQEASTQLESIQFFLKTTNEIIETQIVESLKEKILTIDKRNASKQMYDGYFYNKKKLVSKLKEKLKFLPYLCYTEEEIKEAQKMLRQEVLTCYLANKQEIKMEFKQLHKKIHEQKIQLYFMIFEYQLKHERPDSQKRRHTNKIKHYFKVQPCQGLLQQQSENLMFDYSNSLNIAQQSNMPGQMEEFE